jgi:hypothetical protein
MKTFYGVMIFCFVVGVIIVLVYAPWTSTPVNSPGVHTSLGYAPVWSSQFAAVPGARVDTGGVGILVAIVAFFSIVIGGSAYFFRGNHGRERDLD